MNLLNVLTVILAISLISGSIFKIIGFEPIKAIFGAVFSPKLYGLGPVAMNPSDISSLMPISLMGDPLPDDEEDDDDDSALTAEYTGDRPDPNKFFTGDVDNEVQLLAQRNFGDILTGGIFKKRKKSKGVSTITPNTKAGFPQKLLALRDIASVSDLPPAQQSNALKKAELSTVIPGLAIMGKDTSRIAIVNGSLIVPATYLRLKGDNVVTAVNNYEQLYPAKSRDQRGIAASDGTLTLTFNTNAAGEVTKIIALMVEFTGPNLNIAKDAEVKMTISAYINGTQYTWADSFTVFNRVEEKTRVVVLPTLEVANALFHVAYDAPVTTTAPMVVTFAGLPEKTTVVVRAPGKDSEAWIGYKGMLGLA